MACRNLSAGRSRTRAGSVEHGRRLWSLLGCALLATALLAAGLVGVSPATGSNPIDEKKAEAEQVYAQIITLDQNLSAADEKINLANVRLTQVQFQQKVNRHELTVARRNLGRSRKMIAKRLLNLYTTSSPTTLELILGSQNLSSVLTRIDDANRLSSIDGQVVGQVQTFKQSVVAHARALKHDEAYASNLVAERRSERAAVASEIDQRQHLLSSIKGEIATLEAEQVQRQLEAARAAKARIAAAQAAQAAQAQTAVVGATASTPEGATVVPASGYSSQVVSIAMSYIGVPYVWGGSTPGGFDCSGLVMYAFAQLGISLPHSSYAMWNYGAAVPYDQLQPGDMVFFDGEGHVGLYIGGGEFVDAPYTGAYVRVDSLTTGWALANYDGARRITT
ncbi:MAG TPA: NlpC/P60 family protein [Gaiellaceae bacterium]|nr:NlpC/P60 family protein [Gaiellaceae bacterium]